ncbi:MAG: dihydromonapterin reductase [Pseudomonas sp.]|jgi:dihydromonapterin reductase/dihydrofolate reductase|uniref:dihydromonapterin reductase n=1 Tax=Halopseudomonas sp. TaxID=2901191 RepID=UPI001B570E06|nr:dihydromonapterin reductase [Pseudomonas sp.]MBQ0776791.1 dihydromonapterin reductase [Pseudomonas sp.]
MTEQQSILITGAAQRVGLHCAKRLVEAGYHVIITCRYQREEWLTSPLTGIEVMIADFSSLSGIEEFIVTMKSRSPRLRAIIHNASLWLDDEAGAEAFQTMFMVHMQAPMMINNASAELLDPDCQTDIIHLTDYAAQRGSSRHAAYCASKAGLENLTLSFAKRLAPKVKVNAIAPALIMFNPEDDQAYRTRALEKSALGIEPGPEVVYQSIRYLLDNNYVTGTSLSLNGGRHLK